jgi:DNA-binding NarL/FixJ family response regulator
MHNDSGCRRSTVLRRLSGTPMHAVMTAAKNPEFRIILVDDHAIVREGIRALVEEEPGMQVVGEFDDGASAIAQAARLSPDVAVVDMRMPGLSATETIRGLTEHAPGIHIMVFTSFGEDPQIREALDAGAIGFLLKDAAADDLVRALRHVARGEPWLHPSAQRQLLGMLRQPKSPLDDLTARERSVLALLGQGMSNKAIARQLDLTEGTVKGYVSQILDKLGVRDRTQAALVAVRLGLANGA